MVGITLTKLTRRFGATTAVDSVDLSIAPGQLFFLLGPSGCGKTTIMRMIAGLVEPTSGTIRFGDKDVTNLPTSQRNTALVFQGYALWPHMTVAQNVAFGLDVRKVPAAEKTKRVAEALETVRLSHLGDRRPMQLSGGQQQRVALARALVVKPDVLLLDEPLSNLDAKLRLEMRSEIRRICTETNVTAVYVTHDQEEALSIADRVALIRDGRIIQDGTPAEIYNRPRNRFVADFLGKANFFEATVAERGTYHVLLDSPVGRLRSAVFPPGVAVGAAVTCSVRPESVRLLDTEAAGARPADNRLAGKHEESVYLGHMAEHVLSLTGGIKVSVEELRPKQRDWAAAVPIGFDAADLVVLAE